MNNIDNLYDNLYKDLYNRLYIDLKENLLGILVEKIDREIDNLEEKIFSKLQNILNDIQDNFNILNNNIDIINNNIIYIIRDEIEISTYEIKNIIFNELNNNPNLLKRGKKQQIRDEDIEKIKYLMSLGYSYSQIRKETKWSNFTIGKVLNGEYDDKDCSTKNNSYLNLKKDLDSNKLYSNRKMKNLTKSVKLSGIEDLLSLKNKENDNFINNTYSYNANIESQNNNMYCENLNSNISENNNFKNQIDNNNAYIDDNNICIIIKNQIDYDNINIILNQIDQFKQTLIYKCFGNSIMKMVKKD